MSPTNPPHAPLMSPLGTIGLVSCCICIVSCLLFVAGYVVVVCRRRRMRTVLPGRIALITGAGAGIGRRLALDLYSIGVHIVAVDLRADLLAQLVTALAASPSLLSGPRPRVWTHVCNVADPDAVTAMSRAVQSQCAPKCVSVLVNNAAHTYYFPGIVIGKDMLTLDHSEVERVFAVNCTSHFGMIKHFLPAMLRNDDPQLPGGVVVTMASVMGLSGAALLSDYCASKHAVLGMAESLRFELMTFGAKSVRSLAVCPFAVSTGMFSGIFEQTYTWLHRLLLPILTEQQVSRATIHAIQDGYEFVTVPWHVWYLRAFAYLLPSFVMDPLSLIMGACNGMTTFKGRGVEWSMGKVQ